MSFFDNIQELYIHISFEFISKLTKTIVDIK